MVDTAAARAAWRALEPLHAMVYFAPEARERFAELGLARSHLNYFGSRAAALGPVSAETVIATFFNFSPDLVRTAIPAAWEIATPEAILAARLEAADQALRRTLGDVISGDEVAEAATLARSAAERATGTPEGRPLFAAHAALPWPDAPHLVLWHAQTLLREFRGDGHIAALVVEGLSGLEAILLHAATGDASVEFLRASRGWSDEDWDRTAEQLRDRGLLAGGDELALTDEGRVLRQGIEERTDQLAAAAYASLGDDGCRRLAELGKPLSRAIIDAGLLDATRR